ncbi:MAG TPA: hypothetical protein VFC67_09215 [Prolixibacteraceae bacterium]|nr:hypothetical protein [Prolixibacteraceae bacterium]
MINLLKTISKDVNAHLWMIEAMGLNPIASQVPQSHQDSMAKDISRTYLMKRRLEYAISNLESIRKYCLSEINGTFYDDFEKRWEGTDIEPKYTIDTPYEYILGIWDNHPSPEIDIITKAFIECMGSLNTKVLFKMLEICPEAGPYKQNKDGEMVKSNMSDCQIDDSLKAGSMLAAIEEYNERLIKIQEIAKNRGNLGQILTLIGDK